MLKYLILILLGLLGLFGSVFSTDFGVPIGNDNRFTLPYDDQPMDTTDSTNISAVAKQQVVDPSQSLISKLMNAFKINYQGTNKGEMYVKKIINYFLGIVSLIALVVMIYGFYLVFLGSAEENLKKARKYIVTAAVALFLMGVSWFIISMIFQIFFKIKG